MNSFIKTEAVYFPTHYVGVSRIKLVNTCVARERERHIKTGVRFSVSFSDFLSNDGLVATSIHYMKRPI